MPCSGETGGERAFHTDQWGPTECDWQVERSVLGSSMGVASKSLLIVISYRGKFPDKFPFCTALSIWTAAISEMCLVVVLPFAVDTAGGHPYYKAAILEENLKC